MRTGLGHGRILPDLKGIGSRADAGGVSEFSIETWVMLAGVAAVLIVGTLLALARTVENEVRVRETRAKAKRLRADYEIMRAQQQSGGFEEVIGVDVIEEPTSRAA